MFGALSRVSACGLRSNKSVVKRCLCTSAGANWRVAVVGSGPAGFYAADALLKGDDKCYVDIYDALATPFGLVRSGVAPDHHDTKNVVNRFAGVIEVLHGHGTHCHFLKLSVLQEDFVDRCRFYGNVTVGKSISLSDLRSHYDAVLLSYGADSDRTLNIPGEESPGTADPKLGPPCAEIP